MDKNGVKMYSYLMNIFLELNHVFFKVTSIIQ